MQPARARLSHDAQAGFALVDVLISLIVVGLLVGSLLVGQWYFKGSQVRDLIVQYQMFETATQAFQRKYRAIPGDMRHTAAASAGLTALTGGEGQGDGDGMLEGSGGTVSSATTGAGETTLFWRHLTEAGMLAETYDGSQIQGGIDTTFPRAVAGLGGWAVYSGKALNGQGVNFFHIGRPAFHRGEVIESANTLAPQDASAFDLKLDDGMPAKGKMVARGGNRLDMPPTSEIGYATRCLAVPYVDNSADVTYALDAQSAGSRGCQLRIRFFAQP